MNTNKKTKDKGKYKDTLRKWSFIPNQTFLINPAANQHVWFAGINIWKAWDCSNGLLHIWPTSWLVNGHSIKKNLSIFSQKIFVLASHMNCYRCWETRKHKQNTIIHNSQQLWDALTRFWGVVHFNMSQVVTTAIVPIMSKPADVNGIMAAPRNAM